MAFVTDVEKDMDLQWTQSKACVGEADSTRPKDPEPPSEKNRNLRVFSLSNRTYLDSWGRYHFLGCQ